MNLRPDSKRGEPLSVVEKPPAFSLDQGYFIVQRNGRKEIVSGVLRGKQLLVSPEETEGEDLFKKFEKVLWLPGDTVILGPSEWRIKEIKVSGSRPAAVMDARSIAARIKANKGVELILVGAGGEEKKVLATDILSSLEQYSEEAAPAQMQSEEASTGETPKSAPSLPEEVKQVTEEASVVHDQGLEAVEGPSKEEQEDAQHEEVTLHWEDLTPVTSEEVENERLERESEDVHFPGETHIRDNKFSLTIDEVRRAPDGELYYGISLISPKGSKRKIICQTFDDIENHLGKYGYDFDEEKTTSLQQERDVYVIKPGQFFEQEGNEGRFVIERISESQKTLYVRFLDNDYSPVDDTVKKYTVGSAAFKTLFANATLVEFEPEPEKPSEKPKAIILDSLAALEASLSEEDKAALATPEVALEPALVPQLPKDLSVIKKLTWEDYQITYGKNLESFSKKNPTGPLPGQIWENAAGEQVIIEELRYDATTKTHHLAIKVKKSGSTMSLHLPYSEIKTNLAEQGFSLTVKGKRLEENDFTHLAEQLKERGTTGTQPDTKRGPRADALGEVLAEQQVYSYINTYGRKKYSTITAITKGLVSYSEYDAAQGKWIQAEPISTSEMKKAVVREKGGLEIQKLTTEEISRLADKELMDWYIAKAIIFVPVEIKRGSVEEQDQNISVRVDHYFTRTQALNITSLNPEVKSRTQISLEDFRAQYRRLKAQKVKVSKTEASTVAPSTVQAEQPTPPVPVAEEPQAPAVPEATPDVPGNPDVTTEAGREQIAKELQALIETLKEASYYSIFGQDVVVATTKGPKPMPREYFAMLNNADTQAWYEQKKQKIKEDFSLNIFTRYSSSNALQVWALQRFTEDQETKFLTHIFELQDFFNLPDENLSEALIGLQDNLHLAESPEWQEIFGRAIDALGDKNAAEWMARVDNAEAASAANEQ